MKKIIIFLSILCSFAKAQIVGGFIPLNSTKTPTMGGLRVNGPITATGVVTGGSFVTAGTMSVGSTSTLNGAVLMANSPTIAGSTFSNNASINIISSNAFDQQINFQRSGSTCWGLGRTNTNARFGISYNASATPTLGSGDFFSITNVGAVGIGTITPQATLDVVGNAKVSSTFSLGAANLTGGNTGTVAVLSDIDFPITFVHGSYSPSDGSVTANVYFGNNGNVNPSVNTSFGRVYAQQNLILVGADINIYVTGTAGSSETATLYVRVDNTTNITLTTSATYSAASGFTEYHTSALNTNISSGSYFNINWMPANWVTNPTSLIQSITLWFRRRT